MKSLSLTEDISSFIKAIMKLFNFMHRQSYLLICLFILVFCVFLTSPAFAQGGDIDSGLDPKRQAIVDYIQGLNRIRLPQYAKIIIERNKNDPELEVYIKVQQLQSLIATGDFEEVKRLIAAQPNQNSQATWGMKLTLGDGYYAWGDYGKAQGVYESFFKAFPDGPSAGIKKFYLSSAYKYSQMLLLMDKKKEALEMYRKGLKAKPPKYIERQMKGEMAELMIQVAEDTAVNERDELYAEMEKIIEDLLWVQDIWFGKGIVLLAQMREMKGDIEGCKALLEDKVYLKQLNAIDAALREEAEAGYEDLSKLSPMANCRYLIGNIMLKEAKRKLRTDGATKEVENLLAGEPKPLPKGAKPDAKPKRKSGALQHFVNVYAKYPNTTWAPDAVEKAEEVKALLEDPSTFGAEINIDINPELWGKIKEAQFSEARNLFRQNQFKKAIDAYVSVLNRFPEDEISVKGLSELTRSYIETENDMYAQMLINYTAERFGHHPQHQEIAGNKLIGIAIMYEERKQKEQRDAVYDQFFANFPNHSRTATMLYRFGDERYAKQKYEPALKYYEQVATEHTKSPLALKAKNKMAFCYAQMGDKEKEIEILNSLVDELGGQDVPGQIYISAKFRLAVSSMTYSKDILSGNVDEKKDEEAAEDGAEEEPAAPAAPQVNEERVKEIAEKYKKALAGAKDAADKFKKASAIYKKAKADKDVKKAAKYKKGAVAYQKRYNQYKALSEKYKSEYEQAKQGASGGSGPVVAADGSPAALAAAYADKALQQFSEVVVLLIDEKAGYKYSRTDEDKEANQKILEGAMFYEAMSYVMKKEPENKLAAYRQKAIKKLNALVERFPKSKFGPSALSQVGTLYTVMEDAAEAEKALRKLQADYPDSQEAKMADFALAMNLLNLDRKQQAKNMFKKMLSGGGKYKPSQIQMAGEELMKAKEYDIAADAFKTVMEKAEKDSLKQSAMVYRGEALLMLEDYKGSMDVLDKLLTDYPLNAYTVQAAKNLAQAAGEVAMREANYEKRFDIFNVAMKAIKQARKFDTSPGFKVESEVIIGRIYELKMEAERRHEEPGFETRANKHRNKAVGTYQMIITFADINDPTVKPHVGDAYARCWPLLADMEKWEDLMNDTSKYLERFTEGEHIVTARNWKNRARGKAAAAAAALAAPAAGAPETETDAPVPEGQAPSEPPAPEPEATSAES